MPELVDTDDVRIDDDQQHPDTLRKEKERRRLLEKKRNLNVLRDILNSMKQSAESPDGTDYECSFKRKMIH